MSHEVPLVGNPEQHQNPYLASEMMMSMQGHGMDGPGVDAVVYPPSANMGSNLHS